MSYVTDWLENEIEVLRTILNNKTWANDGSNYHKRCRRDMTNNLNDCYKSLRILKAGNKNKS